MKHKPGLLVAEMDQPSGWENSGPPTTSFLLAMTLVRTGPLTQCHSFSVLEGDCGLEVNWAERLRPPSYDSFLGGVTEAQGEKGTAHTFSLGLTLSSSIPLRQKNKPRLL